MCYCVVSGKSSKLEYWDSKDLEISDLVYELNGSDLVY